jgi:hypothetical protein
MVNIAPPPRPDGGAWIGGTVVKLLRCLFAGSLAAVVLSSSALAAETSPSPFKFEFHGFVATSLYWQDAILGPGNGQSSLFTAAEGTTDENIFSGDIRQTRMNLSLAGPKVLGGATPKGVLEFDLFGGYSGGAFGDESLLPRIRVAYAELNWGNTVLLVGQQNQLIVGQIPQSAAHIAFPSTYTAGTIGWRYPGIMLFHNIPFGSGKLQLAGSVQRGGWNDTACGTTLGAVSTPAACPGGIGLGEASSIPQLEARVMLDGKAGTITWMGYVAGHFDRKDLSGWNDGVTPAPADDELDGWAGEVGGRVTVLPITVAANAYVGKAVGNIFGQILQFGDVQNVAGWVQAGFNLTKEFSVWAQYGFDKPDEDEARAARFTRLQNQNIGAMVRYTTGGYTAALEWFQTKTETAAYDGTGAFTGATDLTGNQVLLTGMYTF